ncbi:hypothetical protein [Pseudomonas putida]|uniref:hypothetical protein n=1 Tax=Pseudomonas putida TaxID=303 RepID=UPI0023671219|nr:hypothetical protein [Pseudomonas putida]MDD2049746.1 hypothetical protein [Pseudomonas putida]
MSTSSESHPDSLVTHAIAGLSNLILDPDEVRNGTHANIPQYANKVEGDVITLTWQGGSGSTFTTSVSVNAGNANVPIPLRIAYQPYIIDNLDSTVSVIYEVKRNNGRTATAKALSFLIKRQLAENLVAPTVREASGNTLEPIKAVNGATVRVAYVGMLSTDILTVAWIGEGGADSHETAQKNGSAFGQVDFDIPISVVAASQGKTIEVRYAVVRGVNPGVLSKPLALVVGELSLGDLPTPTVPEANGSTLDLNTFQGNATAEVTSWPLMAKGQRYWIVVRGILGNGGPYSFYVAQSQLVDENQAGNGLSTAMLRSELEKLRSASSLSLEVKVAFAGGVSEAAARVFPILPLTLLNIPRILPAPSVPEAQNGVIYSPNAGANIRVPATAHLRAGEQVRGVTGGLYTGAVTVTQPGAALDVVVPVAQLNSLVDQGQKVWSYEVLINGQWTPSVSISVAVKNKPFVSGKEVWSARGEFNLVLNARYPYPSGVALELLQSDQVGGVVTKVTAPVAPKTSWAVDVIRASTLKLSFNGRIKHITYRYGSIAKSPAPTVSYYDENGLILQETLPVTGDSFPIRTFNAIDRFPEWIVFTGFNQPGNWHEASFLITEMEWGDIP